MEQDARPSIEVRDAAGRTAEEAVEERLAEVAGYRVERSTTTVGSTEAIVLEPMPGQELSWQVLFTQGGLANEPTFTPADPEIGERYSDVLEMCGVVTGSWAFLPSAGRGRVITPERPWRPCCSRSVICGLPCLEVS